MIKLNQTTKKNYLKYIFALRATFTCSRVAKFSFASRRFFLRGRNWPAGRSLPTPDIQLWFTIRIFFVSNLKFLLMKLSFVVYRLITYTFFLLIDRLWKRSMEKSSLTHLRTCLLWRRTKHYCVWIGKLQVKVFVFTKVLWKFVEICEFLF